MPHAYVLHACTSCLESCCAFIQLRLDSERAHTGLPRRRSSDSATQALQSVDICRDQVSDCFNLHQLSTAFRLRPPPSPNPDPRQARATGHSE